MESQSQRRPEMPVVPLMIGEKKKTKGKTGLNRFKTGLFLNVSEGDTEKWDNHNAIARGWKEVGQAYKPVTFRKLYGVQSRN